MDPEWKKQNLGSNEAENKPPTSSTAQTPLQSLPKHDAQPQPSPPIDTQADYAQATGSGLAAKKVVVFIMTVTLLAIPGVGGAYFLLGKNESKQASQSTADQEESQASPEQQNEEEKTLQEQIQEGGQAQARDAKRRSDINAIYAQVEVYFAMNGHYPSLAQINDAAFRTTNLKGLTDDTLAGPNGTQAAVKEIATSDAYGYNPAPAGCDNAAAGDCTGVTITANLEGGGTITKTGSNN